MDLEKYVPILETIAGIIIDNHKYRYLQALEIPHMRICEMMSDSLALILSKNSKIAKIKIIHITQIPIPENFGFNVIDHSFLILKLNDETYIVDPTYLQFFYMVQDSELKNKKIFCCKKTDIDTQLTQIAKIVSQDSPSEEMNYCFLMNLCNYIWNINQPNNNRKIISFESENTLDQFPNRDKAIEYIQALKND